MSPLLRFDHVSLSFADRRILIDADFSLEEGERVCLLGRNGAGKSTTLKLIAGDHTPGRFPSFPQPSALYRPGTRD